MFLLLLRLDLWRQLHPITGMLCVSHAFDVQVNSKITEKVDDYMCVEMLIKSCACELMIEQCSKIYENKF